MGNFGELFYSSKKGGSSQQIEKKLNNFIKIEQLCHIFQTLRNKYGIDQLVIRNIFSYLIFCKDRFSPKHNWDKCRLASTNNKMFNKDSIRTIRFNCNFRKDKCWSFPFGKIECNNDNSFENDYVITHGNCPCHKLNHEKRDLLIVENLLELDSNYIIV